MNEHTIHPADYEAHGMNDSGIPLADVAAFHQAYGEAMAFFGGIEMSMMHVFVALIRPENPVCAFNAFRSITGFKVQLDMITALVETVFEEGEIRSAWKTLSDKIGKAQQKRNRLAHMHVWHMNRHAPFGKNPKRDRGNLPIEWKDMKQHPDVITTEKMVEMGKSFAVVARAIIDFQQAAEKAMPPAKRGRR